MTYSLNVTELTGIKIKRMLDKGNDGRTYNNYSFSTKIRNKTQVVHLLSGSSSGADRFEHLNLCFDDKNEADLIRVETVDKSNGDTRRTVVYKAQGGFDDGTGFMEVVSDYVRPAQRSDSAMLEAFISNALRRKAAAEGKELNEDYLGEVTDSVTVAEENAELAEVKKKIKKEVN